MELNKIQKEKTAGILLDLSKNIASIFVIGGLIPGSPITAIHMIFAGLFALGFYLLGIDILKGDNDNEQC